MAIKDMNRIIKDKPYYVRQWPASIAIQNLSKALKVFGVTFPSFIDGTYDFKDVLRLLAQSDLESIVPTIKAFVCCARCDGREINDGTFNVEYSGNLLEIFEVFAFVCEVQYRDFFEQGVLLNVPDQPQDQQKS